MMRATRLLAAAALAAAALLQPSLANAKEYFVGGPVRFDDMEIVANYLVGVQMAPMTMPMPAGPDVIHLEADIHATADNPYGFGDGEWVPYLTVRYLVQKIGTGWSATGVLKPMTAKDGPHYADNVKMAGPGAYRVLYQVYSPETNGFLHHIDPETGVPGWWKPFVVTFTFNYPAA